MNELALFAGAGGGLLASHLLGIQTVCAVERDEFCRVLLMQRQNDRILPVFPIWDDVRTFDASALSGAIDLVSGGFPCQAFSHAARGRHSADNLWPDMARIVQEVEPTYVFAENVSTSAIERAAEDLTAMGYATEMLALGAEDLGADHARRRYWLLAHADDKSELRRTINAKMDQLQSVCPSVWQAYPDESGMADGLAYRMDRYKAIGNGQVPVVAATALWILANAN